MRLLSATSLKLHQFNDEGKLPPYAILSHTWGEQEVAFSDMDAPDVSQRKGYQKIKLACEQALIDGIGYVWIDTCCIDKSSSAELSEAINSMFRWYEGSAACYAYLEDVPNDMAWRDAQKRDGVLDTFKASRWFTRGWTLQELVAPNEVYFYDNAWHFIGTRTGLGRSIEMVTSIGQDVLATHHRSLGQGSIGPLLARKSVAQRMAWAANRQTTRPEDMAYSLLGLFDIHMPLIYGEGVVKAFTRLQTEILRDSADHSILAWSTASSISATTANHVDAQTPAAVPNSDLEPQDQVTIALATHPWFFTLATSIAPILAPNTRPVEMTSRGLQIDLRIVRQPSEDSSSLYGAIACHEEDDFGTYVGVPVLQLHNQRDTFFRDPRRPLVKIPVALADAAPLRTVYLATKTNLYTATDALRYAVPSHFLLRFRDHDGLRTSNILAKPAYRWNPATHTMQFRDMPVHARRGVLTVTTATTTFSGRDAADAQGFSFLVAFGIDLNAGTETLRSTSAIYRPWVRLFAGPSAGLEDDEGASGGTSDRLQIGSHELQVYIAHEVLFAKPVFVLYVRVVDATWAARHVMHQ